MSEQIELYFWSPWCPKEKHRYCISLDEEQFKRYKERIFPIQSCDGSLIYFDENDNFHRSGDLPCFTNTNGEKEYRVHGRLHRMNGPAYGNDYCINGVEMSKEEWEQKRLKTIIFSAQKIKTIKKLLYIPEIYENVYYERKSEFISLIYKV